MEDDNSLPSKKAFGGIIQKRKSSGGAPRRNVRRRRTQKKKIGKSGIQQDNTMPVLEGTFLNNTESFQNKVKELKLVIDRVSVQLSNGKELGKDITSKAQIALEHAFENQQVLSEDEPISDRLQNLNNIFGSLQKVAKSIREKQNDLMNHSKYLKAVVDDVTRKIMDLSKNLETLQTRYQIEIRLYANHVQSNCRSDPEFAAMQEFCRLNREYADIFEKRSSTKSHKKEEDDEKQEENKHKRIQEYQEKVRSLMILIPSGLR